tara:strand:+ start:446 stop:1168 length:723 start_codon:yes stop_codon:yes gene_type:complete
MANILNTRAAAQAKNFSIVLEKAGHNSIQCPAMEIIPQNPAQLKLITASRFDTVIFVSQNAATLATPYINDKWASFNIFATGPSTAATLPIFLQAKHPFTAFSTAGLLEMPEMQQIKNKKIAIICGANSKQDLSQSLSDRGAAVTLLPIYERILCTSSITKIQQIPNIDIITSFSLASLRLLNEIITKSNTNYLKSKPLVVVTKKMVTLALALGFSGKAYLTKDATVAAMLDATRKLDNS